MTKKITIKNRKGEVTEVLIDSEDFELISKYKWHITTGYAGRFSSKGRSILMHRFIMGANKGEYVDHINSIRTDNRRSNLRICTQSENLANRKINKNNTSGYKGVSWNKIAKKWCAEVRYRKQKFHIGLFIDKKEAALAYNITAEKLFGGFALLNTI